MFLFTLGVFFFFFWLGVVVGVLVLGLWESYCYWLDFDVLCFVVCGLFLCDFGFCVLWVLDVGRATSLHATIT